MTISFGHGISVTPMQTAVAAAALVNGGTLLPPTFVPRDPGEVQAVGKQVISPETSRVMRYLFPFERALRLRPPRRRAGLHGRRKDGHGRKRSRTDATSATSAATRSCRPSRWTIRATSFWSYWMSRSPSARVSARRPASTPRPPLARSSAAPHRCSV
ncbi:penicillin-binding transpeptidase domain-containing protein [Roseibium salinum]|nr:penicillin-binding transpeptidase domain-containing protein [Roseibium salinum]